VTLLILFGDVFFLVLIPTQATEDITNRLSDFQSTFFGARLASNEDRTLSATIATKD